MPERQMSSRTLRVDFTGSLKSVATADEDSRELNDVEKGIMKREGPEKYLDAKVTVIRDISKFDGALLEDKIDSFITTFPVVMFSQTWCLFCADAEEFLVRQVRVPVHCIKVDKHPQGREIIKYVATKTNHKTTPVIFMNGKFLGGFDEISNLYTEEYLQGLSQADRCQAILEKSQLRSQPYFWFPEKVDGNVVRISGVVTCFVCALSALLVNLEPFYFFRYVVYAIAADFFLRVMGGARISPMSWIAILVAIPLDPNPRNGRPKQFATFLGTTLAILGSVFFAVDFPHSDTVGSVLIGCLAVATFMEGFLDYCVGCTLFRWGVKFGIL